MAPHIDTSTQAIGKIVPPESDGQPPLFEVTISDPNVRDDIWVRVVFNYPPFEQAITRHRAPVLLPPSADGSVRRSPYRWRPTCRTDSLPPSLTQHRMLLIVADRPFKSESESQGLSPEEVFTAVHPDARVTRAQWTINLECK
jgi:hypothetical protein